MRKSIRLTALYATTLMINRYQYIWSYRFNTAGQRSKLLAISKVSAKQNDAPSGGVLNAATVLWSQF
jgi:hypothetical protein